MKPPVVIVTGPTASGKNAIALELAREHGGEIVNADSVQVYKDFNIGAAKPSAAEFEQVPHHLYSFVDPREKFNVGKYREVALATISELHGKNILPIIVGGSGLYIRTLLTGLVTVDTDDAEAEEQLAAAADPYQMLQEVDPETASRVPANDLIRIHRALLVYFATGQKLSALQAEHRNATELPFRAFIICIEHDRNDLYQRIDARVDGMFAAGLLPEVQSLLEMYPSNAAPFRSLGYRHVAAHLRGEQDFESIKEEMKRDTRHFAKRQLTWWRNQPKKLGWNVHEPSTESIARQVAQFIDRIDNKSASIEFRSFLIGHTSQSLL